MNKDKLQRLYALDQAEADLQNQLTSLHKEKNLLDQDVTALEYVRQNSSNIALGLAFVLTAGSVGSSLSAGAKNPEIFDVPATAGNGKDIQQAAADDLKNYSTPIAIDQRLQAKVATTSSERAAWQNMATCYALNHKKGYVDKKDGTAQELMDATNVYNQLATALSKNPNYKQPVAMLPQQKVGYDITFCLQQLGYGKDASGNLRDFDTKDYIYTNDLIIAIMDFQNTRDIKRDGIVGPETLRHFMQAIENNTTVSIDLTISITKEAVTTKDTNTTKPVTITSPVAHDTNQVQNISKDIIVQAPTKIATSIDSTATINKSDVQITLEKYFTGRELGFIAPTVKYLIEKKDSAQLLIKEITTIDKNTDPLVDKKATLLSALEKYGIKNELVVLENNILFYQQANDSVMVDSLTTKKNELLKNMKFTASEKQNTSSENTTTVSTTTSVDRLTKKNLSKKGFKKFKNAIIAIVGGEPDEKTNIEAITRQSLIQQEVLPENLGMNFDEFSSLTPENFVALLNTNKAKWN